MACSGPGTSGIASWWSKPSSARWKLAVMVVDRPAVLPGHDPPGGERAAVAQPLDVVDDRHRRCRRAAGSRSAASARRTPGPSVRIAGDQRLRGDLAAEDALPVGVGLAPAEQVRRRGLRGPGARPAPRRAGHAGYSGPSPAGSRRRVRRGRPGTARTARRSPRRSAVGSSRPAGWRPLLGPLERVVLLLQPGHDLAPPPRCPRGSGRSRPPAPRPLAQVDEVDGQPPARSTCSSSDDRRLRVLELGEVVRDVRDEAHRVVAPLPQPHLEQRLGAGRDPQLAAPAAFAGDQQVEVVGVRCDMRSAACAAPPSAPRPCRRRGSRRSARRPRGPPRAERLPAGVGLGTVEQQVRRAGRVLQQPHDQPGRVVVLVVVPHEGHRRAAGAVVVELVDVEGRHHADRPSRPPGAARQRGPRRCPASRNPSSETTMVSRPPVANPNFSGSSSGTSSTMCTSRGDLLTDLPGELAVRAHGTGSRSSADRCALSLRSRVFLSWVTLA